MAYTRGLDDRERDENGRIRAKNGATLIGHIEDKYGVDLGARRDMKLDNYLADRGYSSQTEAVNDNR